MLGRILGAKKKPYQMVELSSGSDAIGTRMIEILGLPFMVSMSSKRSIIRCFKILHLTKSRPVVLLLNLLLQYLKISGRKLLGVTPVAKVCDSEPGATTFHTQRCGRSSEGCQSRVNGLLQIWTGPPVY